MGELPEDDEVIDRSPLFVQNIFWTHPSSIRKWQNRADLVLSHVKTIPEALFEYEGVDIRIRRNIGHSSGAGFTQSGVRMSMEEASKLWKALGRMLKYLEEEE